MTNNLNDYANPLPENANELEQSVAKLALAILDIPVDFKPLLNPLTCPIEHLPYLANLVGLPIWDEGWSVEKQREIIHKWPEILKNAGDKWAIIEALKLIGITTDFKWWHEQTPEAESFTFKIIAWVNENIFDGETLINAKSQIWIAKLINASKAAHDQFIFSVGTNHQSNLTIRNVFTNSVFQFFEGATWVPEYENNSIVKNIIFNTQFAEFEGVTV